MKIYKYPLFAFVAAAAMLTACNDDAPAPGNPVMDVKTDLSTTNFGDSLVFTINASDSDVPLSTIHAYLYFGDEKVSETVIRTKDSGKDYTGKIYVPYFANVPDGNATLHLSLQNIHFTKVEKDYSVAVKHADYPYLTFVSDDAENPGEYRMDKVDNYTYAFTEKLPQKMKGYIVTPKVGENGNELRFGYASNRISVGAEGSIPFSNSKAGKYTISFNTYTFDGSPFVVLTINGQELMGIDDNTSSIDLDLAQGETITPDGFPNFGDWWIDPDFFTRNDDETLTFKPMSGKYRIIADQAKQYFRVYALTAAGAAQTLAEDGSGALWIIGEHIGKPSAATNAVGWTTENALCMAQVEDKVYEVTVVGGKQVDTDVINFKFFGQMGWGVELKGSENFVENNSDLIGIGDGNGHDDGNLYLLDGVQLQANTIYRIRVDLTGGLKAAKFYSFVEGEQPFEEKRAYLNGVKMDTNDNALYTISTELTQGQSIEVTGISGLEEYFFDNDYFTCTEGNDEITFAPLDGYYKITLNTGTKAVAVTRLNADGSAGDYAGCHAIYMLGWGVGFPNQDYQNGWSTDNGLCMAEVAPNVFQFSGYAGPEHGSENGMKFRNDYVQFKFYQNKSWGHEYNTGNCQFVGNSADIINPDGGDFTYGGGANVAEGDFIVVTLDLTEGEDNAKFSFEIK